MARFHPPQRFVLVCGKVRKGAKSEAADIEQELPLSADNGHPLCPPSNRGGTPRRSFVDAGEHRMRVRSLSAHRSFGRIHGQCHFAGEHTTSATSESVAVVILYRPPRHGSPRLVCVAAPRREI